MPRGVQRKHLDPVQGRASSTPVKKEPFDTPETLKHSSPEGLLSSAGDRTTSSDALQADGQKKPENPLAQLPRGILFEAETFLAMSFVAIPFLAKCATWSYAATLHYRRTWEIIDNVRCVVEKSTTFPEDRAHGQRQHP
ncbi:hypothetical protein MRX96_017297 [Rhipicephalus microplus]